MDFLSYTPELGVSIEEMPDGEVMQPSTADETKDEADEADITGDVHENDGGYGDVSLSTAASASSVVAGGSGVSGSSHESGQIFMSVKKAPSHIDDRHQKIARMLLEQ